jgi:hypothetical protein
MLLSLVADDIMTSRERLFKDTTYATFSISVKILVEHAAAKGRCGRELSKDIYFRPLVLSINRQDSQYSPASDHCIM